MIERAGGGGCLWCGLEEEREQGRELLSLHIANKLVRDRERAERDCKSHFEERKWG